MTVLARTRALIIDRPALGAYAPDVLRLEERDMPELGDGDIALRLLWLSLDSTNRNWLKLEPVNTLRQKIGRDLAIGDPMVGQILAEVVASRAPGWLVGDLAAGLAPWQEHSVVPASWMRRIEPLDGYPLSVHLSVLSHVGYAAMAGLFEVARVHSGETVVVSAAAGATGRIAVAAAVDAGCTVIGLAGSPAKRAAVLAAGASAALDYRASDLVEQLGAAAPDGVHVYFDNVGGVVLDAVLMAMRFGGRIAVCGTISDYDTDPVGVRNLFQTVVRHLRLEGYSAANYDDRRESFDARLRRLLHEGKVRHEVDEVHGFENAPAHLSKVFDGSNRAKLVVRI